MFVHKFVNNKDLLSNPFYIKKTFVAGDVSVCFPFLVYVDIPRRLM